MNDSEDFKKFLRKISSGENTSSGLSRKETAEAFRMILENKATPAQIGAFLIAHRIRRPEPQELAGMLDSYHSLGPKLNNDNQQSFPICFGMPFDGRNRTNPIYPLTTLILLSLGQPVVLQGGKKMPVKYGITTIELFESINLNLTNLTITQLQNCFIENGFAMIYQPDHFPLADNLIPYRDQIGKRPPVASMELIWTSHQGQHLLVSGYVHPPTEKRALETLKLIGETEIIMVKGLEGSIDLPIQRACITSRIKNNYFERLILHAKEFNIIGNDPKWIDLDSWKSLALDALNNKGPLIKPLLWNAGVYLWLSGKAANPNSGINMAANCISSGKAKSKLNQLIKWRVNQNHLL